MSVCMVGWAHTKFARHDDKSLEDLIVEVTSQALADAGLEGKDVDEVYVGNFNGGFDEQDFPSSLPFQADDGFRFKRSVKVENACATGSAALHLGATAIEAKKARVVLAIGVEKMTGAGERIPEILLRGAYHKDGEHLVEGGFAGVFGGITAAYEQRYGDTSEARARIAAKNHRNGAANPYAQLRKDLGFEFCNTVSDRNPIVSGPLRRTDCSLVSDGAAAAVLVETADAMRFPKAVMLRAYGSVNDFLPMARRDILAFEGPERAIAKVLAEAGVGLDDLSFAEVHDCFTTAELLIYEAMGLTAKGEGARAILEGWTERDGRLPVNVSGGLKAKGHPIGATGVSMHVMSASQLTGQAGDLQLPKAELGLVFNMGGAAVANYASVLERVR